MAYHFSANQFDNCYEPKRLNNWQYAKYYPPHPRTRKGSTKFITDNNGRFLPHVKKVDQNPWGNFRSTFELPRKISRCFADEYQKCLNRREKWKDFPPASSDPCKPDSNNNDFDFANKALCPSKCKNLRQLLKFNKAQNRLVHPCEKERLPITPWTPYATTPQQQQTNLPINKEKTKKKQENPKKSPLLDAAPREYIPGDYTAEKDQLPSRQLLLDQKYERDNGIEPQLPLDKNYLGDHVCEFKEFPSPRKPLSPIPLPKLDDFSDPQPPPPEITNIESDFDFDKLRLDQSTEFKGVLDQVDTYKPPALPTPQIPTTTALRPTPPFATDANDKFNYDDETRELKDIKDLHDSYTRPPPPTRKITPGKFSDPLSTTAPFTRDLLSPKVQDIEVPPLDLDNSMQSQHSITGKPHERVPSPLVPAYANFEQAKRMHADNLDHQPLPDCVADLAFRKLQISGGQSGLALELDPIATATSVKTHNAGPTHCTKMKVFRPKTCGVVPKPYNGDAYRPVSSLNPNKKLGAMDLAICWDYKPSDPADEPQPPPHIDGSTDTVGPAVFNYVKSPRDEPAMNTGRSAGVFTSTLGEQDFFDKDIMRRKNDFGGRSIAQQDDCKCYTPPPRARSVSRDFGDADIMPRRYGKQYQSTPNMLNDKHMKALREQYLGPHASNSAPCHYASEPPCRRGFFKRARSRLCHKIAPAPVSCFHTTSVPVRDVPCRRAAFRAGVPKYNAAGHMISTDSGCSMGSHHHGHDFIVPRPRMPYAKKNYDIDTLVPPFRSLGGGAGEGGYPEHWRLSSVYQQAYKPMAQRRRPLIETVFK